MSNDSANPSEAEQNLLECIFTVEQILAMEDAEVTWLIDGLLPKSGTMIISGAPGSGKSFMCLDLAVHMAAISPPQWLGQFTVLPGRVLYIDQENRMALIRRRIQKLGASADTDLRILPCRGLDLMDTTQYENLKEVVATVDPAAIIFDSLRRFHGSSENDAGSMASLMDKIEGIHPTASNIILHHTCKQGGASESRMRGSSDLSAAIDSHLALVKTVDGLRTFKHEKSRWAEEIDPFTARWIEEDDRIRFEYCDAAAETPVKSAAASNADKILEAVRAAGGSMSRKSLITNTGFPENSLGRYLGKLCEEEKLSKNKVGRETTYSVPGATEIKTAAEAAEEEAA